MFLSPRNLLTSSAVISTITMSTTKSEVGAESSSFEAPSIHGQQQKGSKMIRVVESVGTGLEVLALLAAITIVGTAADALAVYNTTSLGEEYLLPLWPADFNMRPSVALVACGSIIILASAASLVHSRISAVGTPLCLIVCKTDNLFRNETRHSSTDPSASSVQLFALSPVSLPRRFSMASMLPARPIHCTAGPVNGRQSQ